MSSTTCEHNDELLALGAMRLLSSEEQARLDAQVSACPACRARLQEYQALAASMPQLVRLETAPSKALGGQPAVSPNGKLPHLPAFFEADTSNTSASERPIAIGWQRRSEHHRLVKVLSGLAAVVILAGLIGGFWLLALSHAPKAPPNPTIAQPSPTTVITYNPCSNEIAKGVVVLIPACGLVVMDYQPAPAKLVMLDPATGKPFDSLPPLQVGIATLAAVSADRHILALGIAPDQSDGPSYIQMVALDTWKLGAKVQVPFKLDTGIQDLAIMPDGTGVYAVISDYSHTPARATLQHYAYDRGKNTLTFRWNAALPFVPGNGTPGNHSFALSADGKTAYIFSATTNPAQLAALPLKSNGIGTPRISTWPSIAPGAAVPGDGNYVYKPGDPIAHIYQPAIMFAPQQNKLYLAHAEAQDPGKDVLTVIDLSTFRWRDVPIRSPSQTTLAAGGQAVTLQPQRGLRPYKGKPYIGRNEVGTVSPDGRWVYLSGASFAPEFNADGTWKGEQETDLGLLKIDTGTGQVVGRWFQGAAFSTLTLAQDGQRLYLFGPPPAGGQTYSSSPTALLVFDTAQQKLTSLSPSIDFSWFILTVP